MELSNRVLPSLTDFEWRFAEDARTHFGTFVEEAWHVVEPATEFVPNWHIDAICDHVQAFIDREIHSLLINVPTGHMKSLLCSVMVTPWVWVEKPWLRFLYASNEMGLVRRDSVKARRVIQSKWYQTHYGESFRMTSDQNAKDRFDNNRSGSRLSTSVGGGTGERGDYIIVDDPHQTLGVLSEKKRATDLEWWRETMPSRLNDLRTGGKLVIQQRLHEGDISGYIMAEQMDEFEHLMLPAEFDPSRKCYTWIGFEDPRTEENELLFPERFPQDAVDKLKATLGRYGAAAQLDQLPSPRGGGMIRLEDFERYRRLPNKDLWIRVVQSWDTAAKATDLSAFSVCQTWLETKNGYYLFDLFRERLSHPELLRTAKNLMIKHKPSVVLVEDKSSGISLIQHLQKETVVAIIAVEPTGDKIMRMHTETPAIESGNVFLPHEADWLLDLENELMHFPASAYADQVDSMSQALKYFREQSEFWVT